MPDNKREDRDHDLLIAMHEILKSNAQKLDEHLKAFTQHVAEDKASFEKCNEQLEILKRQWSRLGGALALLLVIIELASKFWR